MGNKDALEELREKTAQADLPLKASATKLVFGKGNPDAKVVFIGEAPGAQEDLQGIPFVGRAGKELDRLLHTIGLTIDDVYIANILKYRPPGNRDPEPEEIRTHTPFLIDQLRIIRPKVVCTLGNFSTRFLLSGCDTDRMKDVPGITRLHGKPKEVSFDGVTITVIPLYHPAAAMYNRALMPELEKDFQSIKSLIDGVRSTKTLLEY